MTEKSLGTSHCLCTGSAGKNLLERSKFLQGTHVNNKLPPFFIQYLCDDPHPLLISPLIIKMHVTY